MCKIAIISGITDETTENAWTFVKEMGKQMSKPHSNEDDGFGYAAIDNEGKLFGERWFNNKDAFKHNNTYGSEISDNLMRKFKILNMEKIYNNFGTFNEKIRSITLHSRSATNAKILKNTHPFVEDFTSVIHNGVIYNDEKLVKKTSTCDSEVILHEYLKLDVRNKIFKVKKLVNRLEGYYAMGIFSKMNDGTIILDMIKDSTAKLEGFFIKELNTVVFATPRGTGSPVEDTCRVLGFEIVSKYEVKSNKLIRFNALTGDPIGYEGFKPKEFTRPTYNNNQGGYYTAGYDGRYVARDDAYSKAFEEDFNYGKNKNNVIELPAKPVASEVPYVTKKHNAEILERELENILLANKEYNEAEIEALQKQFLPQVINELERVSSLNEASSFNDDGQGEWVMDERFTWTKKG